MTLLVNSQVGWRAFRSYYLCESHYCTPAQAHEKGGVENDIGCAQRNFFSPIPEVDSFEELNAYLHQACLQDAQRRTRGQKELVAQLWEAEKTFLLPLPARDFPACTTRVVKANGYLQVDYDTNRYSVPYAYRDKQLVPEPSHFGSSSSISMRSSHRMGAVSRKNRIF